MPGLTLLAPMGGAWLDSIDISIWKMDLDGH